MLKLVRYILLFFIFVLTGDIVYAKDLEAFVDTREVEFPNSVYLTVKIFERDTSFNLPKISDFVVILKDKKISKNNQTVYRYELTPKGEGFFKIPAISYGNETTAPINIKVYTESVDSISYDSDTLVAAETDIKVVYVNQLVLYKLNFRTRRDLAGNPNYILPKFQDFWKNKSSSGSGYTLINGENYFCFEVVNPLYPMRSGTIKIDPSEVSIKYLGSKNLKTFKTKSINIKVIPLPEIGKPENFSGAVGRYDISATVSKKKVKLRELFVLSVDIKGNGNINSVFEPEIDLPSSMNKYSTNIELNTGKVMNVKTFKINIIPLIEGKTIIPKIKFSYFDTDKNNYVTISTKEIEIDVVGLDYDMSQDEQNIESESNSNIERLKIKENTNLKQYKANLIIKNKIVYIILALFIIGVICSLIYRIKMFFYYRNKEKIAKEKAKKNFIKYFEKAKKSKSDKKEFICCIDTALKFLLRSKINYNYDSSVSSEIEDKLLSLEIEGSFVRQIIDFMTEIEKYKYNNYIYIDSLNCSNVEKEMEYLKEKLDDEIK